MPKRVLKYLKAVTRRNKGRIKFKLSSVKKLSLALSENPLFDADWYRSEYQDVKTSGMTPEEHFLKVGLKLKRLPGPNFDANFYTDLFKSKLHKRKLSFIDHLYTGGITKDIEPSQTQILWSAHNLAIKGEYELAIKLASKYLQTDLQHTVHILKANKAHIENNETEWLDNVNSYIGHFNCAPLLLQPSSSILNRFTTEALPDITSGPMITVIMTAWNAEETIVAAVNSILAQTWQNIQLIIVDDASTDHTWQKLEAIASSDNRVTILRNPVNIGTYASKNIALKLAVGEWVTGHDADDWSHPQRLQNHIEQAIKADVPVSLVNIVRMETTGKFNFISRVNAYSFDGVARKSPISCLFNRKFLNEKLGYWDTVKFGADAEMIARAELVYGKPIPVFKQLGIICLDHPNSLTNHPTTGLCVNRGLSTVRIKYRRSWFYPHKWLLNASNAYLTFPQNKRRYHAPKEMIIDKKKIEQCIAAHLSGQ